MMLVIYAKVLIRFLINLSYCGCFKLLCVSFAYAKTRKVARGIQVKHIFGTMQDKNELLAYQRLTMFKGWFDLSQIQ